MSRRKNAFWGLFADLGGMLVIQLLSLALIPFYLKYISLADYGYWLVILSIIGWIGLADFGIGFAFTRFFIKALADKETNNNSVHKVINSSLLLFLMLSVGFFIIGICIVPYFAGWFHLDIKKSNNFSIAFAIALFNSTIIIPFAIFSGILEAQQKIALNRNIQTCGLLVQFLSSVVFILVYKSIIGLAVSLLAGTVISTILLFYYARKGLVIKFSKQYIDKNVLKSLFTFGGYFQVGRTANTIATNTDNLFIASYLEASKVPVYNFTGRLPLLFCNAIASKIPIALFSGLSQILDQGNYPLFKKTFEKLFSIITRLAFFASIMIFFVNEKFVNLWVGEKNFGGYYLNLVFVYFVFFETMIRGTGIVIQIYGDLKWWAVSSVVESAINIGLSIYFLYAGWGILGLALSTAIARTCTIGIYWMWFLNKKGLQHYSELITSLLINLLRSVPLFVVLFFLFKVIHFHNLLLELIVYCVSGFIINLVCYDLNILYLFIKKRSFKVLFAEYMKKY